MELHPGGDHSEWASSHEKLSNITDSSQTLLFGFVIISLVLSGYGLWKVVLQERERQKHH